MNVRRGSQTRQLEWAMWKAQRHPPSFEAENLTKVYRSGRLEVPAVRGVSFAVERGEFVAIVGPSGLGEVDAVLPVWAG